MARFVRFFFMAYSFIYKLILFAHQKISHFKINLSSNNEKSKNQDQVLLNIFGVCTGTLFFLLHFGRIKRGN